VADLYYIEENYYNPSLGYFVYTADAAIAQSVTSTMTCDAGKITQAQADMVVTTVITATISHIEGADLFALSESQLATQAQLIRDSQLLATAIFDIATDGRRLRDLSAQADATSSVSADFGRSRAFLSDQQAAFSFVCDGLKSNQNGADLISTSNLNADISVIKQTSIEVQTIIAISVSANKISDANSTHTIFSDLNSSAQMQRDFASTLIAQTEITATISHIEGADLSAFSDAVVSIQVEAIREYESQLVISTEQTLQAQRVRFSQADISIENVITIDALRIQQLSATFESSSTQSAQPLRIFNTNADLVSQSTTSADVIRQKSLSADLVAQTEITATISHIEGADLSAFGQSQLVCDFTVSRLIQASLAATSVSSIIANTNKTSAVNIESISILLAASRILAPRTTFTTDAGDGYTTLALNNYAQFGSNSLSIPSITNQGPYPNESNKPERFIVVGTQVYYISNGYTYVSSDQNGTSWTRYTNNLPSSADFTNVIRVGSNFVVFVGSGGNTDKFYTSSDGQTWTATTGNISDFSFSRRSIVRYVGTYYYVIGVATTGVRIWRGTSFTNLSEVFSQFSSNFDGFSLAGFINNGSELSFHGGNYTNHMSYSSTNGTTWTSRANGNFNNSSRNFYAFINGQYVVGHYGSSASYISYASSVSGTWTRVTIANDAQNYAQWITGGNSQFIVKTTSKTQIGSNLSALSDLSPDLYYRADASTPTIWTGTRFINFVNNKVNVSTNANSYTQYSLPVPENTLPGKIKYLNLTNDFNSIATIDFWLAGAGLSGGGFLSIKGDGSNKYLEITQSNGSLQVNGIFNDGLGVNAYSNGLNSLNNGWNHIRIGFESGVCKIWINGQRQSNLADSWGGTFSLTNAEVWIKSTTASTNSLFIDELLITDQLLTSTSVSSFTPPTKQWDNTATTDLLVHFNTDFYDDSRYAVIEQAQLLSTVVVTASLTGIQNGRADSAITSTLSATAQRTSETVLSALGLAELSAAADRIRGHDAQIQSTSQTAINADRIRGLDSNQTATTISVVDAVKTVDAQVDIAGISIQFTVAALNRTTDTALTSTSQLNAVAVKTAGFDLSIGSTTVFNADGILSVDFESDLISQSQTQIDGQRIRYYTSSLDIDSQQQTDVGYIAYGQSNLDSTSELDAVTQGLIKFVANLQVVSTTIIDNARTRSFDGQITSTTGVDTTASRIRENAISAISTTDLSAVAGEIVQFSSDLSAFSVTISATAKIGSFMVAADVNSVLSATPVKIARGALLIESTQTLSSTANRTRSTAVQVISDINIQVEGTTNITGEGQFNSTTVLTASAGIIKQASVNSISVTTVSATASVTRAFAMLEQSMGELTASVTRIRSVSANISGISIELVLANKLIGAQAQFNLQSTMVIDGRDIDLEKYVWIIPEETRAWKIQQENRTKVVREETRIHKIRRY